MSDTDKQPACESTDAKRPGAESTAQSETPITAPPGLVGRDGRLTKSINCIKCEYDLRGQLETGTCPECGETVFLSINRGHLWLRQASWLQRWSEACIYAFVALCSAMLLGVLMIYTYWAHEHDWPTPFDPQSDGWSVLTCVAASYAVFTVCGILGVWRLTAADPVDPKHARISRRLTRALLTPMPVVLPGFAILGGSLIGEAVVGASYLLVTASAASLLFYLGRIAKAISARGLRGVIRLGLLLMAGLVLMSTLLLAYAILDEFYWKFNAWVLDQAYEYLDEALNVLLDWPLLWQLYFIGTFMWIAMLLLKFRRCFSDAAKTSAEMARAKNTSAGDA